MQGNHLQGVTMADLEYILGDESIMGNIIPKNDKYYIEMKNNHNKHIDKMK